MSKNRTFFSCVIPSVLAFALSGVYAIVDGFFIGNSIGDIGLSTINVAYPVVALMQAIGTGIGMGGAVVYSITGASGDQKKADLYAGGTGTFLLIASIVIYFSGYSPCAAGRGRRYIYTGEEISAHHYFRDCISDFFHGRCSFDS